MIFVRSKFNVSIVLSDADITCVFFMYGYHSGIGWTAGTLFARLDSWPGKRKNTNGTTIWTGVYVAPDGTVFVSADEMFKEVS